MSLVFQRGSTLMLHNGSVGRRFLISSASLSQTYLEESRDIRTIHNNNQVKDTFTNSKGEVTIEFEIYLSNSDGIIFEWFGMSNTAAGKYSIIPNSNYAPSGFDLYLIANGANYKVTNVHVRALSFSFSKDKPIALSVSATGSLWEQVTSVPTSNVQSSVDFRVGSLDIVGYQNLAGITLEMTKELTWLRNKTLDKVLDGSIFTNNTIICNDVAIAGTITNYKRDNSLSHSTNDIVDFTYGNFLNVRLNPCKTLDRWSTDSVHRKMTDFKLLPNSTDSYVQFI